MDKPMLLSDRQIQQFIADGYLVIRLNMDPWVHRVIDKKFNWLAENERNPGNNIVARLPELNLILDSNEVRGAMISLLGEDHVRIPHCHWHYRKSETMEENYPNREYKDIIAAGSHQDSYNPSKTGKIHAMEYIRFMYYSHDIELENGPTHVSPGTQYHQKVEEEDAHLETPVLGKAGTVFISHFDLIHSGSPNLSDRTRNMIKFIYKKNKKTLKPSWDHKSTKWINKKTSAAYKTENCWKYHWHQLCNIKETSQTLKKSNLFDKTSFDEVQSTEALVNKIQVIGNQPQAIDFLISKLNTSHQAIRTSAIYALGDIGKNAVQPLLKYLKKREPTCTNTERVSGGSFSFDDATHSLIACGAVKSEDIEKLLTPSNFWSKINAMHLVDSLEIMSESIKQSILKCLNSKSDLLISYAALTIGKIDEKEMVPVLLNILDKKYRKKNHDEIVNKRANGHWPNEWAIHFNAALSLLRLSRHIKPYESEIEKHLSHPNGQVSMMICDCMKRIKSKSSLNALVDFYERRRWDDSLSVLQTF